ncbi:histone PARylation factor 1 isoform X2 [Odontomachus brunneus]|uniref:histone PARylation factor 1 isoform X2 n=1 Tax=Odontomachus brunneus TaxID=486640 RepID=UPI0013F181C9|nr:histone PARylation factor 1 isoform X2 [Odontomachus brunneus]
MLSEKFTASQQIQTPAKKRNAYFFFQVKQNETLITGTKRKDMVKDNNKKVKCKSPPKKLQKTCENSERNVHNLSPSSESDKTKSSDEDDDKNLNISPEVVNKDITVIQTAKLNEYNNSYNSAKLNASENLSVSDINVQKTIKELFLVEMPKDFYQFYEFCKSISKDNPLLACKSACLKLVGPYDVLEGKIKDLTNEKDKEKYLIHWRYYYDPPEFQTIIKCDNKEGLHFGYWRDDIAERPVFVAKNCGNVSCVFESVAENIFGAIDTYLQNKAKSANPFEKTGIMRLHSQLKNFAKQHNITLEKNTTDMRSREKKVVARTFHKAGIVVPYDKKTQLGYRDLAATDNELQKILKQIEEASTLDKRKASITQLDEIVRLATIAADECDFGTCLELGHDLFSNGSIHVQGRALQMLSVAYTHLQRPQFLEILEVHLKNRRKGCELSVI